MDFWHVISGLTRDPEVPPLLDPTFIFPKSRTGTPKTVGETLRLSCVELQYVSTYLPLTKLDFFTKYNQIGQKI